MKHFKLFRTGSLILGLWFLISAVYVTFSGFEKFDCCAMGVKGYGFYSMFQWLIDARNAPSLDCGCDLKNMTTTFSIIPIDLIFGSLWFLGTFGWLQFKKIFIE